MCPRAATLAGEPVGLKVGVVGVSANAASPARPVAMGRPSTPALSSGVATAAANIM